MSASGTSSTTDVAEKFQRLVKEYHKVKEMCKVLSNGVAQERAKSLKLESALKDKEASFRKIVSEKEAVEFHNLQLTKRIELLQNELEKKSLEPKKRKKSKNEVNVDELYTKIKVLEDELYNKLHTNEALTRQINEFDNKEKVLRDEIQVEKDKVQEITFMMKMAPIVAEYDKKNGYRFPQPVPLTPANGSASNGTATNELMPASKQSSDQETEVKVCGVVKFDAEAQVDFELNNNTSGSNKLTSEISAKQDEIKQLVENIRRLEDLKEKQSLDITLLKRKLELTGNSSAGMDSAEQATKLARARIREVMNEREEADKHARYFEKEVGLLLRNIKEMTENKNDLEGVIKELKDSNSKISDELISVRKSYDSQLSQMSDLVIELNKKIEAGDQKALPAKQEATTPTSRSSFRNLFGK